MKSKSQNHPASTAMTAAGSATAKPILPKAYICGQSFWTGSTGTYYEARIPVTRPPSAATLLAVQQLLESGQITLIERIAREQKRLLDQLMPKPLSTARRGGRKGK